MPLTSDILEAAAILEHGSDSVRAVMADENNRFTRALADLQRVAMNENIPIAIVGGLGAIHYGYPAATQDIDVAVGLAHLDKFLEVAPLYGFKVAWRAKTGWHILTHEDVEINVVPEGGLARNNAPTAIPGPEQLGVVQGLGYANLAGWLELKLSSGRQKDRAHVVEVMKKTTSESLQATRLSLSKVHETYAALFDQLWQEAQEEKAQENRE